MKRVIALFLCIILCLSLCACGVQPDTGKPDSGSQGGDQNAQDDSGNAVVYDHTSDHPLMDTLLDEWVLDGNLSWLVMPVRMVFNKDGTCLAEFPEHAKNKTMELYWGIVPDCVGKEADLYVRVGEAEDVWYLFKINGASQAIIAEHCDDPAEMHTIDGLSADGISGMWFNMKKKPASEEFLTQLYGTWNGEKWGDFAPVALITFNADGNCFSEEQTFKWRAWHDSDISIELEIRQGEKAVIGGRLSKLLAGEEVYYELRLWDAAADGIGPAPDYSKQEQTQ